MFDFTIAKLVFIPPDKLKFKFHDIDYSVIDSNVKLLRHNPKMDLRPVIVMPDNGQFNVHDGRHRAIAYLHAERAFIPAILLTQGGKVTCMNIK